MSDSARLGTMAKWLWEARVRRLPYRNLPQELRPTSIAEAYAAQEAYYRLAEPVYGAVAGAKIATTTKVMQQLMGIDHPCGGAIFSRTIHPSPAKLHASDFVNPSKAKSRSGSAPICRRPARHGRASASARQSSARWRRSN